MNDFKDVMSSQCMAEKIRSNPVFKEPWYHTLELAPKTFTPGKNFENIHLTRELLRGCEIQNQTCLDIGAQDCLISILLRRRGASRVVAQDLQSNDRHVDLIKQSLEIDFDYISGFGLPSINLEAQTLGVFPFDVVVFSGVLYHMFDPLGGLASARGLLRNGGLMIVETSAILDDSIVAYFNAKGRYFKHTNYWQVSLTCLDYMLRFLRLAPIDCVYYLSQKESVPIVRIAVVCRALNYALAEDQDLWMIKKQHDFMTSQFLNWKDLDTNKPPLNYTSRHCNRKALVSHKIGSVDLYKTVVGSPETRVENMRKQVHLRLNSRF